MSKALDLVRLLINGANEYEKETGNKNPTVYLSRNNLLVIEKALLKAQEPKKYVDELKLVEKKLKALEIIKEKRVDLCILTDCDNVNEYNKSLGNFRPVEDRLTYEEFNLLKEMLE